MKNISSRLMSAAVCLLLILSFEQTVFAALSDSAALKKAALLFGNTVRIGTVRNRTASNWTKQIGIETIGCDHDFTVLGEGFNTWDAAFADYDAKVAARTPPIKNHFTDPVNIAPLLTPPGFANPTPINVDVLLDGMPYGPQLTITNGILSPLMFDPATMTKGAHVFCFQIHDDTGRVNRSPAWMFFRD